MNSRSLPIRTSDTSPALSSDSSHLVAVGRETSQRSMTVVIRQ